MSFVTNLIEWQNALNFEKNQFDKYILKDFGMLKVKQHKDMWMNINVCNDIAGLSIKISW